jgi:tetratricopeptide (TPR) repeat protein
LKVAGFDNNRILLVGFDAQGISEMSDSRETNAGENTARPTSLKNGKKHRKTNSLRLGVIVGLTVIFFLTWQYARPFLVIRQSRQLLENEPEQAAKLLERYVSESQEDEVQGRVLWAHALLKSGRWQDALGCFSQIRSPGNAKSHDLLKLAEEAIARKTMLLAVLSLDAIDSESVDRPEAVEKLMTLHLENGSHTRVTELAKELSQLQPSNPAGPLAMARVHEIAIDLPAAAHDYRAALGCELQPSERSNTLRAFVRTLIKLGETKEARSHLEQLRQHSGLTSVEDQISEVRLLRLEGSLEAALKQAGDVVLNNPDNLEIREIRGTIAMELRNYMEAESDFRFLVQRQPLNKEAHYKLASTLAKLNRPEEAAVHFAENRRLLELSNRVVQLQSLKNPTPEEQGELISVLEKLGLNAMATQYRRRLAE